jgi:branched-chain amino acid transport system substrate-binding protein
MSADKIEMCPVLRMCRAGFVAAVLTLVAVGVADAAELLVAHVGPYSGPAAAIGTEYGSGATLYFDHINGHGGVNGAKIALASRDDAGDPALTRSEATALMPYKPIAFIGAAGVRNVNSLISVLEQLEAPLVGPMVDVADVDATSSRSIFHIRPNARQEVDALVRQLDALGFKKIALCGQGDLSRAGAAIESESGARPVKPVVIPRCGDDLADIDTAVSAVMTARAQALIFVGKTRHAAELIRALRAKGSFAMIVASSSVDPQALAAMLPLAAKIWLAVAENVPNPDVRGRAHAAPIVREFLDLRAASGSQIPLSRVSLAGFVSAKILVEAIRRAGAHPTSADVVKALSGPQEFDIGGMTFNFSPTEPARITYTRFGIIGNGGAVLN